MKTKKKLEVRSLPYSNENKKVLVVLPDRSVFIIILTGHSTGDKMNKTILYD